MKRFVLILLSVTMILSLCFLLGCDGCGKKGKSKKTNTSASVVDSVFSLSEEGESGSVSSEESASFEPVEVEYVINYYLQNANDDEYTLRETVYDSAQAGSAINAEIKSYDHYIYNSDKSTVSLELENNGDTLEVYYDLELVTANVNVVFGEETLEQSEITRKYGEMINYNGPAYLGYDSVLSLNGEPVGDTDVLVDGAQYTATFAVKEEMEGYEFLSNYETCIINGVKDDSLTQAVIPNYVTAIGVEAFKSCIALTSVTIPDSVVSIGDYAFADCYNLVSNLTLDNVKTIGTEAFSSCTNLVEISLNGIESIGERAFYNSGLVTLSIGSDIQSIGSQAFSGCDLLEYEEYGNAKYLGNQTNKYLVLVKTSSSSVTSCQVHADAKIIYYRAFYNRSALKDIVISGTITQVGEDAFTGSGIENATIPVSFASFMPKTTLKSVRFTNTGDLPVSVFKEFTALETVDLNGIYEIGSGAFESCTALKEIIVPGSVNFLGTYTFYNCTGLESVHLCESLTAIGNGTFLACTNLKYVDIPDSIELIGALAFYMCSALENVFYYGTETEWGEISIDSSNDTWLNSNVVYFVSNVAMSMNSNGTVSVTGMGSCTDTLLVIPSYFGDNRVIIEEYAFKNNANITGVIIGFGVQEIGDQAFYNCIALESVKICDGVETIGKLAFMKCSALTDLTIGNGVITIAQAAFEQCSSLENIVIPDSVTSLGFEAFCGCSKVKTITLGSGLEFIDMNALQACNELTEVTFANPQGWKVCLKDTTNWIEVNVTSPTQNAGYFKNGGAYSYNYVWQRGE